MKKYFVVSDVHSYYYILRHTLEKNGFDIDNQDHILVVCGDLFDRGNESLSMMNFVTDLLNKRRCVYVRGNHEDLLLDCLTEIQSGKRVGSHHYSNKTMKTICDLSGIREFDFLCNCYDKQKFDEFAENMRKFINNNTVNYAELDDFIFVHGWVPCYQGLESYKVASSEDWQQARWDNGMEMWSYSNCRVEGKTVVCGHWHCSWGWSHIRRERKEFPPKNLSGWEKSFEPFIDDGIIAIDSAVPYTNLLNCLVIESENEICT